ncbi:menaquinone biosynthetic enzyme MqnA/MqnD family protein [Calderihabitans maritimus]|uniref:Chorismate dehydratase n=1 Tax=Calderihabitans maritimus TaxID=1246530 RepID=A0A1Z5HR27_9FIRM|nr:menaquinone biosynthesis protein [Calderihabitans maritimus]GAW91730.1 hypothetical protein Dtox_1644 [Calderihabitans maritimus]
MVRVRLGKVDYLNCLPLYDAIETGKVALEADLFPGTPTLLNQKFLAGELDITPLSSIEYARNSEKCIILPGISISADGRVASILLFSKVPLEDLEGKKVALTSSSATSVVLLKILLTLQYNIRVRYETCEPRLSSMLEKAEAALLIGDDALVEAANCRRNLYVYDLGEMWKKFTGYPMIYALWVIRRDFAEKYPEEVNRISRAFICSQRIGMSNVPQLVAKARARRGLPEKILYDYFATIRYDLDERYQRALKEYYSYAYRCGLIERLVDLEIWGGHGG